MPAEFISHMHDAAGVSTTALIMGKGAAFAIIAKLWHALAKSREEVAELRGRLDEHVKHSG